MFDYSELDEIFNKFHDLSLSSMFDCIILIDKVYRQNNLKNDPKFPDEILKRCENAPFLTMLCGSIGRVPEFERFINEVACERNYYAQKILKKRLPEPMHNRMIADIVSSDPVDNFYAKEYFDFLKEKGL